MCIKNIEYAWRCAQNSEINFKIINILLKIQLSHTSDYTSNFTRMQSILRVFLSLYQFQLWIQYYYAAARVYDKRISLSITLHAVEVYTNLILCKQRKRDRGDSRVHSAKFLLPSNAVAQIVTLYPGNREHNDLFASLSRVFACDIDIWMTIA